jgi:hypothetical protein
MRRALALLVVAGGLAALFVSASQEPSTRQIVTEVSGFVVFSSDGAGCSIPQREILLGGPVGGPVAFYCATHREAQRFQKRLDGKYAGLGAVVRGTRVVLPLEPHP